MSHQQFHETVAAQEQWEEETIDREKLQGMVTDLSNKFAIQEREREEGWIRFAAEMQKNIDKLNQSN